ncbi:MAG: isoleucine--tRNA ligase [Dehalococcoidales bacterium]|nr:MAG: isoleucine--tRNA ligase [Dehalococcoidales bacterium]
MFQPVNSRVNFPQLEETILELWQRNNTFIRSVEAREGGPRFTLYEGPPTTNASPGIHFVMPPIFKDVIPRYKVMKGYYAPRIGGWDTHGLPVELEVEKELGFTGKGQIEEYGIEQFNARCRESVYRYIKEFEVLTERIGYWVDMENSYITLKNEYIETCWWVIKQIWDKGLVYQGYKVTPHCPRCGTSLSSHEVAQGYKEDTEDPSVYIKFKIAGANGSLPERLRELVAGGDAYFLAWTTTPWTLPGNTALAVADDAEYAAVNVDNEYLIMASARLMATGLDGSSVIEKFEGSELVGVAYEPLFNPHKFDVDRRRFQQGTGLPVQEPDEGLTYRVITTDFVSMEDGTGIVHIAPAYGEVDYQAGQDNDLDFVHNVDLQGNIIGSYPFSGKFVKDADPMVLEDLEKRGLLFRSETVRHTYPFCWRCEAPLLYYAKQTWYIRTTAVKQGLIRGNSEINWYPEHIKYGRFGDWLENNVDWAFSRERYWGTPLPVWNCPSCGKHECVGSVSELEQRGTTGMSRELDLHRPFVDEMTFACPDCGGEMRRVPEVIDAWFDSGAMPIAQYHYPFENTTMLKDERFPADYICEAIDQTRGWFYSLHAISTLLFDRPCYRNVICHGHILDDKGEKMSKTKANKVLPWEVIDKYGADALRWYLYTSAPPGNSRRYSDTILADITRHFMLTLWNVYSFFVTYANIDEFTPSAEDSQLEYSELDRWILSELNQLVRDVDTALENYDPTGAGRKIETFVDGLSNWYVRRSRRRFWKSESDADKLAAHSTLYHCLVTLAKLLAPFTPFLAEELYQNLVCSVFPEVPDSVHLTDFPVADKAMINEQLSADTQLAMKVSSLGRAARSQAGIKVRQPLSRVIVKAGSRQDKEGLERLSPQVLEELNTKTIEFADSEEELDKPNLIVSSEGGILVAMDCDVSSELAAEGLAREIVHRLQNIRRSAGFDIADHITTYYDGGSYVKQVVQDWADYIKQETLSRELVEGVLEEDFFTEGYKLSGHEIKLGVKRID